MDLNAVLQIGSFQTSYLELVAVLSGLVCVWFMKKESLLSFPFGLVNVGIYIYIFFHARLYANAGINGFFFIMSVYGLYNWSRKDENNDTIKISRSSRREMILNAAAILVFFLILWTLLVRYTESKLPVWDAMTTAVYIVAQWLLSRKKIENWLLWIASDTVMIGLCAWEGLMFSSFQYLVFTIIAILGFREWRTKLPA
jgi:nicotinamide mononucleotide transporter